jgi:anthranilate synthase component 1
MFKHDFPKINLPRKPHYTKITQDVDFFELFKVIEKEHENCFLLESLGGEGSERYFVLGFDPSMIFAAKKNILSITDTQKNTTTDYDVENPYYTLQEILPQDILTRNYAGGLVGFLNYEAINYFESVMNLDEHEDFENFKFGLYLDGLVLDKMTGEIFYFYYEIDRSDEVIQLIRSLKLQKETKFPSVGGVAEPSEDGVVYNSQNTTSPSQSSGTPPQEENNFPSHSELVSESNPKVSVKFLGDSLNKEDYTKVVLNTIEEIKNGNSFQAEAGFKSLFEITGDKLLIYEKLREVNPSPFMFYNKFGDQVILGASPELLFRMKEGFMQSSPLAGTIVRGKNELEDTRLARELLNDPKEIAEHNMLVDMHRNDIGRVAKFGTVRVAKLMEIKKFALVQHISSDITGIAKDDVDMFDALASNFPMGTLSGAPKIESMKIIAANEKTPRGPYGGGFGLFALNGDCHFCGILRSLYIKGDKAYSQTSAGIVFDSKPDKEYQEIEDKLAAMKRVLEEFRVG